MLNFVLDMYLRYVVERTERRRLVESRFENRQVISKKHTYIYIYKRIIDMGSFRKGIELQIFAFQLRWSVGGGKTGLGTKTGKI